MMDFLPTILTTVTFFVIIGAYFLYITRPKKTQRSSAQFRVDSSMVRSKWEEIQSMMSQGGPANYRQAIMEADKLVDLVLKSKVKGETMGERLKNAKNLFDKETYDKLWLAHKIRNKVAHEADFEGLSSDANLALKGFEAALREIKVL